MDYEHDKVDEMALALLFLTLGSDNRAWKGMDWDVSNRLYEKGWIENPRNKNQSFELTVAGREACIRLFRKHFGVAPSEDKPDATLLSLPINIGSLESAYYRDESKAQEIFLDAATGLIVLPDDEETFGEVLTLKVLSNNPRYLPLPICTPEERSSTNRGSEGERKRIRKRIRQWLESQTIVAL